MQEAVEQGIGATAAQELMQVHSEELIRDWTNQRVRAGLRAAFGNADRAVDYLMNGIPEGAAQVR